MSQDARVLASDAFEGRAVATAGEAKTIQYLIERFTAAGLRPGGDDGAWTQAVLLNRFAVAGDVAVQIKIGQEQRSLTQGQDIVVTTSRPAARVTLRDAPVVFVGYGIHAPERQWDDFKGVDLNGKIALVLVNDADFETPAPGAFEGKAITYYGRWIYKIEEAARQGASGVLIIHETGPAGYGWQTVNNSTTAAQYDIVRADEKPRRPLLQGWIQRDTAAQWLAQAGFDLDALKQRAQRADFRPIELSAIKFSADYRVSSSSIVSRNIVARLPGRRPDETVIYSAHWDHIGVGPPDASGDTISNGALDNALGVAALLELARLHAAASQPDRSIMFLATTAEESGLLGAEYYAAHPLYPLETTAAVLNMDVLITAGPIRDFVVIGPGKSTLEDDLAAEAQRQGKYVTPDLRPEVGSFYRGDQFPFAKAGVPVLAIMDLGAAHDLHEGGRVAGEAWVRDFTARRYHQPTDEWSADWDLRGAASEVEALYRIGSKIARSRDWPQWRDTAEFKTVRDSSERLRR